uniref:Uncharacterized protein n=2 Tax=Physarum polycephalum TaxID=5791 RepID=Q9MJ73_PHYPO|nr:hypothetical protein PhpooMp10 [Physarum polycephalum]BAB08089.1 unnamed protein product [Physarum polycephalum]
MFNKLFFILQILIKFKYYFMIFIVLTLSLCFAIIIHYNYNKNKKLLINKKQELSKLLDYLYIKDIKMEILDLFLLNLFTIGLIFSLRNLNIGATINIFLFRPSLVILSQIISLCVLMYVFYIYNLVIKYKFYKIYLFMCQFETFIKICDIFTGGYRFYELLYDNLHDFIYIKLKPINKINSSYLQVLMIILCNKILYIYAYIKNIFYILRAFFPEILLFISLISDLNNREIKTFYYILAIYPLMTSYRTIKEILGDYDMLNINDKLTTYFYEDKIHDKLRKTISEYERTRILIQSMTLYYKYDKQIREYILRDFKRIYQPYSMRLIFLGILILYYNFCYSMSYYNCMIITIPLLLSFILYEHSYQYLVNFRYLWIIKILYYTNLILVIYIFIIIYLSRNTLYFITDNIHIFNFELIQEFSQKEKYDFFIKYLNYTLYMEREFHSIRTSTFLNTIMSDKNYYENLLLSLDINTIKVLAKELLTIAIIVEDRFIELDEKLMIETISELIEELRQEELQRIIDKNPITKIYNKIGEFLNSQKFEWI